MAQERRDEERLWEEPLARLYQGLKELEPSLVELADKVDEAYGRGGYMVKDPNDYDDYSEFLRTEMIIDEPKFEQFMMRFANMNVRIWVLDKLAPEDSKLSVVWGAGPMGKLAIIQQLDEGHSLFGVVLKMALYFGLTPDAKIPQFFFS